jgi:hypothetical protein
VVHGLRAGTIRMTGPRPSPGALPTWNHRESRSQSKSFRWQGWLLATVATLCQPARKKASRWASTTTSTPTSTVPSAAGRSTPSATKSTAGYRHDPRRDGRLRRRERRHRSGGATGGAVLGSTHATRATPPGETMVYPGEVASNTVESGIPGHLTEPGIPLPRTLFGQAGNACAGLDHIRGIYVPV